MTRRPAPSETLRLALREMARGNLLVIAERAVELVPAAQLDALLGDFVKMDGISSAACADEPLLDDVRKFYEAALAAQYYETVEINNKRGIEQSKGTEAFAAEFDRLLRRCVRAQEPPLEVLGAFEVLFGLLRYIDEGNDDVIAFVDEGGSSDVGVNWRVALPAYFACLGKVKSADEFAFAVDRVIRDFASYDRPRHLFAARSVASAEQQAALDALVGVKR